MITWLQKRLPFVQGALLALMLNGLTQVDCCVSAFASEDDSLVVSAQKVGAHEDHSVSHDHSEHGQGHSGHDAGSCDCKDGLCAQGLVALASADEVFIHANGSSNDWQSASLSRNGKVDAKQFDARAPPFFL